MEFGSIERELYIDAEPDVVFEVVSRPEHIREWWSAETDIEPAPGAVGALHWRDEATGRTDDVAFTVVDAEAPRLFSFRWSHPDGEPASPTNSLLVSFELRPSGAGTVLRMTETGFREQGWEVAVLEEQYNDHVGGWDFYIPRIGERVRQLVASP